jgi:deoxycytidine triphosphate deaminase
MTNKSQAHLNRLAKSDDEAAQRFEQRKSQDPYPEIIPALLNSADIFDYVALTGMIHPFDSSKLKSASYSLPILGKIVYWDENNERQSKIINRGDEFVLKPNSIAFITVEPMLRLPDYIAFRFNLKITNVYRGILLGTGPLVDPGFVGLLSIPLHNLTTNSYTFVGGEDLIWMEFTKLSPNKIWDSDQTNSNSRIGEYVEFRPANAVDVDGYLRKADQHRSIRSSIPGIILDASKSAEKSARVAESIQKRITIGAIVALFTTSITLYFTINALVQQVNSLVQDSVNYVKGANDEIKSLKEEIKNLKNTQKKLEKDMEQKTKKTQK